MQQLFQTDSDNSNLSERIMILYRSLKIIITASFLASSLLTYTLWDLMPHNELIIWLSLVTIVSIIRTVTLYRYHQSFKPDLTKRYGFYAHKFLSAKLTVKHTGEPPIWIRAFTPTAITQNPPIWK